MDKDKDILNKIRKEYENNSATPNNRIDSREFTALFYAVTENINRFDEQTISYLQKFDNPLRAIYEFNKIPLYDSKEVYNYHVLDEFISGINAKIDELISHPEGMFHDRLIFGGYTEMNVIEVNKHLIFIGENPHLEYKYTVIEFKEDSSTGEMKTEWAGLTNDYLEAIDAFVNISQTNISIEKTNVSLKLQAPTKPDLLAKINNNKQKVEQDKAIKSNAPKKNRKHGEQEV